MGGSNMRKYSMESHHRKTHQRWLNYYLRETNKALQNNGMRRFEVIQKATAMDWFPDKSGGLLYCWLQFRDKETGIVKDWYTDALALDWQLPSKMNDFIIKHKE